MRSIGGLIICVLVSGCGGYSLKLIHEPSTLIGLETIIEDCDQAQEEMVARYDDLFGQVKPWIPSMVAEARRSDPSVTLSETLDTFQGHRDEYMKATRLIERSGIMAKEVKNGLRLQEEPGGNVQSMGLFVAGAAAGAAIASAF